MFPQLTSLMRLDLPDVKNVAKGSPLSELKEFFPMFET